jgi:NAD-dependent dihydropyrimidine dehydrogenase PreA subunit
MAYTIGPDCVLCGICEGECPVSAIKFEDERFVIDSEACTDCGACEEVCLVGAITPDDVRE